MMVNINMLNIESFSLSLISSREVARRSRLPARPRLAATVSTSFVVLTTSVGVQARDTISLTFRCHGEHLLVAPWAGIREADGPRVALEICRVFVAKEGEQQKQHRGATPRR